jgi:hypothetical protein
MARLEITHVRQPVGSNLCGQACVAMAAGVRLEVAVAAVGKRGKTQWGDLRRALARLGIAHGGVKLGAPPVHPGVFITRIHWTGSNFTHFVIRFCGAWIDPDDEQISFNPRPDRWIACTKVVSHMSIHV